MSKALVFARREYLAAVRTKGFLIAMLLVPVLMGGSGLAMFLLKDQVDTRDRRVAVVDRTGRLTAALRAAAAERNATEVFGEAGRKVRPAYLIEEVAPEGADPAAQRLALSDRIRAGELYAFLEIGPGVLQADGDASLQRITYHSKNAAIDEVRQWIGFPLNQSLRRERLTEAGLDAAALEGMLHWLPVEGLGLVTRDAGGQVREARHSSEAEAILVPLILVMLLFMMVLMGAVPHLQTVMEEKNQRIAEVLLGSMRPFQFMLGKLIGSLGVTLTASAVYVLAGVILTRRLGVADYVPYQILPWFFAFMVLEILMVGAAMAALGSACSDPKEAQGLSMPAMMPIMIPLFVMMPILQEPSSTFATVISFIPLFTPMLMLLRMSTPGGIPAWQPWVGLIGVLAATVFSIWAGGRVFRIGILLQGTPPRFSTLARWALRG